MPKPKSGDGPWGEAIRHLLDVQRKSQADIVRATGIQPKTVSRVVRGFHTQTRVLEKIAQQVFKVPIESVLVSPARQLAEEDRQRVAVQAAQEAVRLWDERTGRVRPSIALEESSALAQRMLRLTPERRKEIESLIAAVDEGHDKKTVKPKTGKQST